ncbi:Four And A Half Lim Domains Protein 1 [Manis pentadactyla]|nr:Four And A Half Lim Domains Protein 1 [Manis pentadactyla]
MDAPTQLDNAGVRACHALSISEVIVRLQIANGTRKVLSVQQESKDLGLVYTAEPVHGQKYVNSDGTHFGHKSFSGLWIDQPVSIPIMMYTTKALHYTYVLIRGHRDDIQNFH